MNLKLVIDEHSLNPYAEPTTWVALKLGRLDESEACGDNDNIDTNFTEAHYNLGNTLKELGKLDESEACIDKRVKPDYAKAHYNWVIL